jgi:hypothetical protein
MPDMPKKPNWFWIAAIITVLVCTGVLIAIYSMNNKDDVRGGGENSTFTTTQRPLSYYFSDTGNASKTTDRQ